MHPRVPSNLASIRNFAFSASSGCQVVVSGQVLDEKTDTRDRCNRYLMWIASHLTTVSCLDPETAASISNLDLLIERGVAVMPHYRWVDSNYDFSNFRESKDQVDEYTVFWTIKDFFPTLARETGTLLAGRRKGRHGEGALPKALQPVLREGPSENRRGLPNTRRPKPRPVRIVCRRHPGSPQRDRPAGGDESQTPPRSPDP